MDGVGWVSSLEELVEAFNGKPSKDKFYKLSQVAGFPREMITPSIYRYHIATVGIWLGLNMELYGRNPYKDLKTESLIKSSKSDINAEYQDARWKKSRADIYELRAEKAKNILCVTRLRDEDEAHRMTIIRTTIEEDITASAATLLTKQNIQEMNDGCKEVVSKVLTDIQDKLKADNLQVQKIEAERELNKEDDKIKPVIDEEE